MATATLASPPPAHGGRHSAVSGTTLGAGVIASAARDAFAKLDPRCLTGNPVILATEVVAALATLST
ncbi:hypothetical protein ACNJUT_21920, partial [Mycobacterium tuberculosis]